MRQHESACKGNVAYIPTFIPRVEASAGLEFRINSVLHLLLREDKPLCGFIAFRV